jgi:hypothetical protein
MKPFEKTHFFNFYFTCPWGGRHGCDHMVVGFTTTHGIGAYHHYSCEFVSRLWRGALNTTLCDKVYQ